MKLFLDTANIDEITEVASWGVLSGVTTNPSLCAKEGAEFEQRIKEICSVVEGPVSAEAVSQERDGMVEEGRHLATIAENVVVKLPVGKEGLAATARLAEDGIRVNMTLVFSANQAILAARAGAAFVSPFLGRLDDIGWEGLDLLDEIVTVFAMQCYDTEVLAASLRHPMHVTAAARMGADIATMPYKVFTQMLSHPLTDAGNRRFLEDWEKLQAELKEGK